MGGGGNSLRPHTQPSVLWRLRTPSTNPLMRNTALDSKEIAARWTYRFIFLSLPTRLLSLSVHCHLRISIFGSRLGSVRVSGHRAPGDKNDGVDKQKNRKERRKGQKVCERKRDDILCRVAGRQSLWGLYNTVRILFGRRRARV